jgi:DNA polymerase V
MVVDTPVTLVPRTSQTIPLVSASVEAGFPSPAEDFIERGIDLNQELIRNPISTFYVRVKGESMRDAGIQSGDVLIVDKSLEAQDRQIVVAQINGDFTVNRLRKIGGRAFLEPANESFDPIEVIEDGDYPTIWGLVTFVIHKAR